VNKAPNSPDIWRETQQSRRKPGLIHLVILTLIILTGILVGSFSSLSFEVTSRLDPQSPAYGVNYFWVGIMVQQVGAIWFGGWGVLAGAVFPFFSNAIAGTPFYISLAYVPANAIQAFLPGWVFRRLRLDPQLNSSRDYLYLILAMVAASLMGALWSVFILTVILERLDVSQVPMVFLGWLGGNLAAGLCFNIIVLKGFSGFILKTRGFVRKWWV
jgi:hypothetical protein